MQTQLRLLSENEKTTIHEQTLRILSKTGVRIESEKARKLLKEAGAEVHQNDDIVTFPSNLVEESLGLAPKNFSLGARRPGRDLTMNNGDCTLIMSGEGTYAVDRETGKIRNSTFQDWLNATRLGDVLDEIGVYWKTVELANRTDKTDDYVDYLIHLFRNFSKHVQDTTNSEEQSRWLLEVLQVVFGSREEIRKKNPFSFVLCPQSPLMIDRVYTDAYLELRGWGMPVAIMPMPLMGATAPASLISTIVTANCEILATLCLVQAAKPNTPVIYAPVSALMDPRTGMVKSGGVEEGLMSAAAIEMSRYYGLPSETSGLGTGRFKPNVQSGYETALTALIPMLILPDMLEGAGLIGDAMVLSLEQMLLDTEVFNMCRRARQGIATGKDKWLIDVIEDTQPGGHFIDHPTTVNAFRGDEVYINRLEAFEGLEEWQASSDKSDIVDAARAEVNQILSSYQPLPLGDEVEKELFKIKQRAISLSAT
jgi:trimethylamine--corrinoid protein Co-methyltransferase